MLFINRKLLGLFLIASLSSACGEKTTYDYLMQHPDFLQQRYHHCIEHSSDSQAACNTIMRAQNDFAELVNQRDQDPEGFGARVLQEEENRAYLKQQFHTAEQKNNASEIDKSKQAYQAADLKVKILLSVIAATSNV